MTQSKISKPARKPQMKDGVRWLYENVDEEYANDNVRRNAEKYLGVTKLPIEQNQEYIPFPEHVENLEGPELLKIVRA